MRTGLHCNHFGTASIAPVNRTRGENVVYFIALVLLSDNWEPHFVIPASKNPFKNFVINVTYTRMVAKGKASPLRLFTNIRLYFLSLQKSSPL